MRGARPFHPHPRPHSQLLVAVLSKLAPRELIKASLCCRALKAAIDGAH